ncbi:MAG TPA: DUF1902 domain-containing protein [Gammaproteobacteria bacterium]|nr:DUF1902 domain-containing protein [Gammaproteobacteria bacterium]
MAQSNHDAYRVVCHWDGESQMWYVAESTVPGLATEAVTPDQMLAKLRIMIPELLQANGQVQDDMDVPIDLLCQQHESVHVNGRRR